VRRLLKNQPSELEQSKRESIFHTHYKVFENICSMILDGGSKIKDILSSIFFFKIKFTQVLFTVYKWIFDPGGK